MRRNIESIIFFIRSITSSGERERSGSTGSRRTRARIFGIDITIRFSITRRTIVNISRTNIVARSIRTR